MEISWKVLEEDSNYEINNLGVIRNIITKKEKYYGTVKNGTYYKCVLNYKQYLVHRLVAKYFVINKDPERFNVVNHLDENTHNNKADNLEWTTNKDNLAYSNVAERVADFNSKFKVIQYDKHGNVIKIWNSKEACYAAGFTQVKSFFVKKGFNRFAYDSFWFSENEKFDIKRYKPKHILNIYDSDNNLVFTGGTTECAKFMKIPTYHIQNKLRSNIKFKLLNYILVLVNSKI